MAIVQETFEPDVAVSLVARRHGLQPNQLFAWRKLASHGAFTATQDEEEVVPAAEYRALHAPPKIVKARYRKFFLYPEQLNKSLDRIHVR